MANDARLTDPRNVAETYANIPYSVYLVGGMIHITLGIERPAIGAQPGQGFKLEKEVALRIVLPADAALTLAKGITDSLSPMGQAPLNKTFQS